MSSTIYAQALSAIADADDRIVVMTAENRAPLRGIPDALGRRFIDVGIAEQTLVGMAAGLALRGRIPVVHALAAFLTMRAFEFIRTDVGIAHLPVKFIGFIPGVLSDGNGPTHQAVEDIALMRQVPGMTICCPADGLELIQALHAAVQTPDPVYIRYIAEPVSSSERSPFTIGRAEVFEGGNDVAIVTYGYLTRAALDAAQALRDAGVGTTVVHVRTVAPLDTAALLSVIARASLVVTLEDHRPIGGLYSLVAETCLAHRIAARVVPIGFHNGWFTPGRLDEVLGLHGLTGEAIARRVAALVDASRTAGVDHSQELFLARL